ncbi:MAG: hypothetical protein ACMVY4_02620 [Minwuia sp.]|uniref:hypothetical protein n=1 Tax=Minwuia sp. TaxID=2493630 RepID=UPI003A85442B
MGSPSPEGTQRLGDLEPVDPQILYPPESFIADLPQATVTRFGDYQVYEFDDG